MFLVILVSEHLGLLRGYHGEASFSLDGLSSAALHCWEGHGVIHGDPLPSLEGHWRGVTAHHSLCYEGIALPIGQCGRRFKCDSVRKVPRGHLDGIINTSN